MHNMDHRSDVRNFSVAGSMCSDARRRWGSRCFQVRPSFQEYCTLLMIASVHANPEGALVKAKWPQMFQERFRQTERGMIEYGQHVFSE